MSISINLEVFRNVLVGVAEEMGAKLQRCAYSSNIKERRDFSCAIFNREGKLAAQAVHIPVHLGSMPILVETIIDRYKFEPGDIIIANNPFQGGTHLPDITLIEPIFNEGRLWGFAAARAHHSDIGGMAPGSMPDGVSIFQEGIIIPPLLLKRAGKLNDELLEIIVCNTRTPKERKGDLYAQIAALSTARERIGWIIDLYGFEESLEMINELINYSERMTRLFLRELPDGTVSAVDYMEDDRTGENVPIRALINICGDEAIVDFTGTAPQREGNINAPLPVTLAATYYVFRCLLGDHIPANAGCFAPIKVKVPKGCLLNAQSPYAVSAGNVETSQRVVDVLFLALSKLIPGLIPAASCGTMNNIAIGGFWGGPGDSFAYYETIGGGAGAGPKGDGESAIHTHMTNTRNTSIEALETIYPFMITRYEIRKNSGGEGHNRGGDGIIREYLFHTPCQVSIISERRRNAPYGLEGGKSGEPGVNRHFVCAKGESITLPGKTTIHAASGDHIIIETPGGGGYGSR